MVSFLHSRGAFDGVLGLNGDPVHFGLKELPNGYGSLAAKLLACATSPAMLDLLESYGLKPDKDTLSEAIRSNDYAIVNYLVNECKIPLAEDALRMADDYKYSGSADLEMMRFLLAKHACVDPPGYTGALVRECSRQRPSIEALTLFLEHGAKMFGNSTLDTLRHNYALDRFGGRPELVRLVLDWRQARRLWVVRSAQECKRVAPQSALRLLPRDMARMVGGMLGEENSSEWEDENEQNAPVEEEEEEEEDEDGGY
jgi:hypothetical protein